MYGDCTFSKIMIWFNREGELAYGYNFLFNLEKRKIDNRAHLKIWNLSAEENIQKVEANLHSVEHSKKEGCRLHFLKNYDIVKS